MTVPALKDLLKPTGLTPVHSKNDLVQQILADRTQVAEGHHQVTQTLHARERALLREIFIDIWDDPGPNGAALRGNFAAFFEELEDSIPMEGTTPEDVATLARTLLVSLL
jgi:hypothetical protein